MTHYHVKAKRHNGRPFISYAYIAKEEALDNFDRVTAELSERFPGPCHTHGATTNFPEYGVVLYLEPCHKTACTLEE